VKVFKPLQVGNHLSGLPSRVSGSLKLCDFGMNVYAYFVKGMLYRGM